MLIPNLLFPWHLIPANLADPVDPADLVDPVVLAVLADPAAVLADPAAVLAALAVVLQVPVAEDVHNSQRTIPFTHMQRRVFFESWKASGVLQSAVIE